MARMEPQMQTQYRTLYTQVLLCASHPTPDSLFSNFIPSCRLMGFKYGAAFLFGVLDGVESLLIRRFL